MTNAVKDPQDEAMQTRFICSIGNKAVVKAIFKVSIEGLTFKKVVKNSQDTKDAAKSAEEQCCVSGKEPVLKVKGFKNYKKNNQPKKHNTAKNVSKGKSCYHCNKDNNQADECRYKDAECKFCRKKGHIENTCRLKKR